MDENKLSKLGEVRVADEVIIGIAGLAATEVKGVAALAGGLTHDKVTCSGVKKLQKCVRLSVEDKILTIKIALVLDGSVPIPAVSFEVETRVAEAIEQMTGMKVAKVEVTIAGVTV